MPSIAKMNVFPPGGYQYVQPGTGMNFGGNEGFRSQCKLILVHRKSNSLPRATPDEVAQDLMDFTCARVPGVCTEGSQRPLSAAQVASNNRPVRRCGSCGGRKAR